MTIIACLTAHTRRSSASASQRFLPVVKKLPCGMRVCGHTATLISKRSPRRQLHSMKLFICRRQTFPSRHSHQTINTYNISPRAKSTVFSRENPLGSLVSCQGGQISSVSLFQVGVSTFVDLPSLTMCNQTSALPVPSVMNWVPNRSIHPHISTTRALRGRPHLALQLAVTKSRTSPLHRAGRKK
jgi:hypothetical protein